MKPVDIWDYDAGIADGCGQKTFVHQDIITTPFFNREYCDIFSAHCERMSDAFYRTTDYGDSYENYSLYLEDISPMLFMKYARQMKRLLKPMLDEHFMYDRNFEGVFSPFINRFRDTEQAEMPLHCETSRISLVVKLNDEYEGGDLIFPRQDFTSADVPVGTAMLFPGMVTHPHKVDRLISGNRYTLVGFSLPVQWEPIRAIHFDRLN
jgi:hypothetical protein